MPTRYLCRHLVASMAAYEWHRFGDVLGSKRQVSYDQAWHPRGNLEDIDRYVAVGIRGGTARARRPVE
nr:hypothetical protein CFP56_25789 [Quercus suber]